MNAELNRLVGRIETDLPVGSWAEWPGGWLGEIEAALIDSVFSIQARYGRAGDGTTATGVRRVIARWREHRAVPKIDDLNALGEFDAWAQVEERMGQRTSGRRKSEVVADVAVRLAAAGCPTSAQFEPGSMDQRRAWVGTHGLGEVTWEYFAMLLGRPGVKADTMLTSYVGRALDRTVAPEEVTQLVKEAAERLRADHPGASASITATTLDHAIWNFERRRRGRSRS